ncbi:hypothetical protein Tco_0633350 [Tanacetum coccineum]
MGADLMFLWSDKVRRLTAHEIRCMAVCESVARIFGSIEDVVTKKIVYHLFDGEVELFGIVFYHISNGLQLLECLIEDEDNCQEIAISIYIGFEYMFEVTWIVQDIRHKFGLFYFSIKLEKLNVNMFNHLYATSRKIEVGVVPAGNTNEPAKLKIDSDFTVLYGDYGFGNCFHT